MSSNPTCTVYVGNLDERVTDRVLYDILIQAGRLVDLYIPRDRETDKPKGFAFAEYESEEVADYAVRLFSGLVTIYNRTLRFGISGQDKSSPNVSTQGTPTSNSTFKSRINIPQSNGVDVSPNHRMLMTPGRAFDDRLYHERGSNNNYEHRRGSGASRDNSTRSRSNHYDSSSTTSYGRY